MVLSTVVLIIETSGAENLAVPLIISSAIGKVCVVEVSLNGCCECRACLCVCLF